jgi:peroxiredoxin
MNNLILTILFIFFASLQAKAQEEKVIPLYEGQFTPHFAAMDTKGDQHDIQQLNSKLVLLSFFNCVTCSESQEKLKKLIEKKQELENKGIEILTIWGNDLQTLKEFISINEFNVKMIGNENGELFKLFGIESVKSKKKFLIPKKSKKNQQIFPTGTIKSDDHKNGQADFLINQKGNILQLDYKNNDFSFLQATFEQIQK